MTQPGQQHKVKCALVDARAALHKFNSRFCEGLCYGDGAEELHEDCWGCVARQAIQQIDGALAAQAQETPYEIGRRLAEEGMGLSSTWGAVACDDDVPEVIRGWTERFDELQIEKANATPDQ